MNETASNKQATSKQPSNKASPSLEEQLKNKQDDLKSAQEDVSALQTDIKELQTKLAEFKQATANYENISNTAKELKNKVKDKIDSQAKIAISIIGEPKAKAIDKQVDDKIKELQDALTKQKSEVKQARDILKTANDAWSEANDALQEQQAIYELIKKQPNDTDASLKEVQNLVIQAESAHDKDEHGQMYLLTQIAKKALLNNIKILSQDKYSTELLDAQNETANKKQEAEKKKNIAEQKAAALNELSLKYAAANASSQKDLLNTLKKIAPADT